jgi:hypothetical protein
MVIPEETLNRNIFSLGNGQWDIPKLRLLLEDILGQNKTFEGFEVAHDFQHLGFKKMLINARQVAALNQRTKFILVAFKDVTGKCD